MARLKGRIDYYPPVRYSYVKTFFGPKGETNTEAVLATLKEAAAELARESLVEFSGEHIRISPRLAEGKPIGVDWLTYARRILLSYYTHSVAGKVGPSVVLKEVTSKLRRARGTVRLPESLARPQSLLKLAGEVALLTKTRSMRELLAVALEKDPVQITTQSVAWPLSEVKLVDAEVDGRRERVVVKRYGLLSTAKWLLVANFVRPRAAFMPRERLANEYFFNRALARLGYNVPRIRAVSWDKAAIVADFVEGKGLRDVLAESGVKGAAEAAARIGEFLAKLHSDGISLRDARPENFILDEGGEVWVVDLEQASKGADPSLDVAVFLLFRTFPLAGVEDEVKIARSFVTGYLAWGDPRVVKEAISKRMLALFTTVAPPAYLLRVAQVCTTEISRLRS